MLNPGNNFRFSTFFNVAAIGPNHDIDIKVDKTGNVKAPNKKIAFFLVHKKGNIKEEFTFSWVSETTTFA